jgi:hypothetical protein
MALYNACNSFVLLTLVAAGAAGCSAFRPPRQVGFAELHGSAAATELLASSGALEPRRARVTSPAAPTVALVTWGTGEGGLPERLLHGTAPPVELDPASEGRVAEVEERKDVPDEGPTKDDRRADVDPGSTKAKASADVEEAKRREQKAEDAQREAAKAAADAEARREAARAQAAKERARFRASLVGSPRISTPSCKCEPGDPLCGCL